MDKSLKFFNDIYKSQTGVKLDPKTGVPITNINGNVTINYYDKLNPEKKVRTETKPYSFNAGTVDGQIMNYLGNSPLNEVNGIPNNPEETSDIKLSSIINWTQLNAKSLYLMPKHFVSLKDFNTMPANKFIILRRFTNPCSHNLFKGTVKPIATLVGYYDFDNIPVKISFNEKWKQFDSNLLTVIQDVIGIKFESIPGVGDLFSKAANSPFAQDLLFIVAQNLGLLSPKKEEMPYGEPNLIHDAAIRDVTGEALSTGLESDISVDFESTYVLNEKLGGLDGKKNMLDLLAEATTMGTSTGEFVVNTKLGVSKLNDFYGSLQAGNISDIINAFKNAIGSVVDAVIKLATPETPPAKPATTSTTQATTQATTTLTTEQQAIYKLQWNAENMLKLFTSGVNAVIKSRFTRYKWNIKGAISALTGSHTAPWHISLGNPKHPWFVCGNMVLEKCEIIPGGGLSYNDMFTELTIKITLRSGRVLHKGEIESLFNSGTGRIYDKVDKHITYNVIEGTDVVIPNNGETIIVNNVGNNQTVNQAPNVVDNTQGQGPRI
jgi:hypothetical protein